MLKRLRIRHNMTMDVVQASKYSFKLAICVCSMEKQWICNIVLHCCKFGLLNLSTTRLQAFASQTVNAHTHKTSTKFNLVGYIIMKIVFTCV